MYLTGSLKGGHKQRSSGSSDVSKNILNRAGKFVKMHSCQASSTQEEDQGVTRKTLRIRNVELEGNVLIQNAFKALEMEATLE